MAIKHVDYYATTCDCCGRETAEKISDIPLDWGVIVSRNTDSRCEEVVYEIPDADGKPISFPAVITTGITDYALCPDCYEKVADFIRKLAKTNKD